MDLSINSGDGSFQRVGWWENPHMRTFEETTDELIASMNVLRFLVSEVVNKGEVLRALYNGDAVDMELHNGAIFTIQKGTGYLGNVAAAWRDGFRLHNSDVADYSFNQELHFFDEPRGEELHSYMPFNELSEYLSIDVEDQHVVDVGGFRGLTARPS